MSQRMATQSAGRSTAAPRGEGTGGELIRGMVAATKPTTIRKAVQKAGTLTDEAVRNGSLKKNTKKRGNDGEPNRDRNAKDDNKRSRTGNAYATTNNLMRREYTGKESSNLGFSYEIEIASGQRVEIDKVIRGCELDIKGHTFDIDLIPFRSESFDVIVGMDWLSKHKAEIIFHKKVVRILLRNGKTLRVIGKNQKKRLPPNQEIKFRINLIPRAIPVMKSSYRLAPSAMEELSGQLKELRDNGFIRPSSSPWRALILFVKKNDGSFRIKIEAVKNWEAHRTPSKFRSFLGLAGYYRRFIENFSKIAKSLTILTKKNDYDYEICYHTGKANAVADALSRKDMIKPKRIRAMNMTLQSSIKDKILTTQKEASDESTRLQRGLYKLIEHRSDEALYYLDSIYVPLKGDV
nr:reverse transcriptase domain-containing protein [Tanacetum cinerariifolium]